MTRARSLLDWKAILGLVLGVGFLLYALRDVDAAHVWEGIRLADPFLLLAGVTAVTLMYVVRAVRWRPLIEPVRSDTAFRPRFAATMIGFGANNLLPARIGEFARAYALARLESVPVAASFGSLVVERLLDGFTVVAFLLAAMVAPGFPEVGTVGGRAIDEIAFGLLALFTIFGIGLLAVVLWSAQARNLFDATVGRLLPASLRGPVRDALRTLLDGFKPMRSPALLGRAVFWSIGVWLVGGIGFWLAFLAFGIDVPFSGALFLQSLIALAVALPSAPGFFGLYEAGARVGLVGVWGVSVNQAMSFAIGFHIATFLPVTLIGLYYAWRLGISWREVERSEEVTEQAIGSDAPGGGPPDAAADQPAEDSLDDSEDHPVDESPNRSVDDSVDRSVDDAVDDAVDGAGSAVARDGRGAES